MANSAPRLVVIAGPNGAGKSTIAAKLLPERFGIREFVNADVIAQGLSAFDPDAVAFAAGRTMLLRLQELADARADFAFETTLASRTFAPWIAEQKNRGYVFELVFVWLRDADLAEDRVKKRVASGGHSVPGETVQRRFGRSLRNFFELYRPLADSWTVYDNSNPTDPRVIARGAGRDVIEVLDADCWRKLEPSSDMVHERPPVPSKFSDAEAMDRIVVRAVREALLRHKLLGQSIAAWQDGRVVEIRAEDIQVDPVELEAARARLRNPN
jgi:predicted ABC-type ATPase